MSDKEAAALMHAVEKYGTLRDRAMIIILAFVQWKCVLLK